MVNSLSFLLNILKIRYLKLSFCIKYKLEFLIQPEVLSYGYLLQPFISEAISLQF